MTSTRRPRARRSCPRRARACSRSTARRRAAAANSDGVVVSTLGEAVTEHAALVEPHLGALVIDRDKFAAQNTGDVARRRVRVRARRASWSSEPIVVTVIQATAGQRCPWRSLIVVEAGAQVTVVEQYLSCDGDLDAYFNPVSEIVVGDGATLEYLCVQDLSEQAWILGSQRAQVGRDAHPALGRARLRLGPAASCGWRPTCAARGSTAV